MTKGPAGGRGLVTATGVQDGLNSWSATVADGVVKGHTVERIGEAIAIYVIFLLLD